MIEKAAEHHALSAQPRSGEPDLVLTNVVKRYGSVTAVRGVSLSAARGEFISFLGPSGCGKTTTLAMIAGFQDITSGSIHIRRRRVDGLAPEKRNTGMVFQNYALFPHMSVADNVGFGLRMRSLPKSEIRNQVTQALALVRMSEFADRRPTQLSGGQQQRVALARALVIRPDVLLLDEPLGALDRQLREQMQLEIKSLQRSVGITTVFVTHDQDEALSISERVVVMNQGLVEQIGTPGEIYGKPDTVFVATFVGKSNMFHGTVASSSAGKVQIDTAIGRITIPCATRLNSGQSIECLVRPEKLRIASGPESPGSCRVPAQISQVVYHGSTTEHHVAANGQIPMLVMQTNERGDFPAKAARDVAIEWLASETVLFVDGKRCN